MLLPNAAAATQARGSNQLDNSFGNNGFDSNNLSSGDTNNYRHQEGTFHVSTSPDTSINRKPRSSSKRGKGEFNLHSPNSDLSADEF